MQLSLRRRLYWRYQLFAMRVRSLIEDIGGDRLHLLQKLRVERLQASVACSLVPTIAESGSLRQWTEDNAAMITRGEKLERAQVRGLRWSPRHDDSWVRIGITDEHSNRSTWARLSREQHMIELCYGKDGDDGYCVITAANPAFAALWKALDCAIWIAEGCH